MHPSVRNQCLQAVVLDVFGNAPFTLELNISRCRTQGEKFESSRTLAIMDGLRLGALIRDVGALETSPGHTGPEVALHACRSGHQKLRRNQRAQGRQTDRTWTAANGLLLAGRRVVPCVVI